MSEKVPGCDECDYIIQGPCMYHECLQYLNITAQQLKIARALDREKVERLRSVVEYAKETSIAVMKQWAPGLPGKTDGWDNMLSWLPAFDTKGPDDER